MISKIYVSKLDLLNFHTKQIDFYELLKKASDRRCYVHNEKILNKIHIIKIVIPDIEIPKDLMVLERTQNENK